MLLDVLYTERMVRKTRVKRGPNVTFPPKKVHLALPRNPLTKIFCHYFTVCPQIVCALLQCIKKGTSDKQTSKWSVLACPCVLRSRLYSL